MNEKNKPVYTIKVGAIDASVWENTDHETQKTYYSLNVSKSYKDKDGNWTKTNNIGISDIPKAIIALEECYKFVNIRK